MKKRIAIISPDTLCEASYHNLTLASKRVYQLSNYLSTINDFEITILYPSKKEKQENLIQLNKNILVDTYSFSAAFYNWSEELDKKLLKYDFVIIQTSTGVGFQNCTVLPKKINVIVDAWLPMITQYPVDLLSKHRIKRKFTWDTFLPQYKSLMQRANCILCANDKQRYFYEGQFFMIEKLGWDAFKFSPIHRIPYMLNAETPICKNSQVKNKVIWYGDIHQFDSLVEVVHAVKDSDIFLDIIYRTNDSDIQKNKYSLSNLLELSNDNVEFIDAKTPINFDQYLAGVFVNNNWLEDRYSNNCDIFELLFRGIPVITNNYFELYQEYPYLINNGVFYSPDISTMKEYLNTKNFSFSNKSIKTLREQHTPENVVTTLINYIRTF